MLKKLNEVNVGTNCIVKLIEGEGKLRRRIFDMGITPGAQIYVRKVAPLGDPVEITIRGYELTLRKDEAKLITVDTKEN